MSNKMQGNDKDGAPHPRWDDSPEPKLRDYVIIYILAAIIVGVLIAVIVAFCKYA